MKPVRLAEGPTSRNSRTPSSCSACTVSVKRTRVAHCHAASARISVVSAGMGATVAQDQIGRVGSRKSIPA
jgi:hypothetical protein